jgi:hypothetical protein
LTLPNQRAREYGYQLAYKLAREQLAKIDDIELQCRRSGAQYRATDSEKVIIVEYLNRLHLVRLPEFEVSLADSTDDVSPRDKVLILHYIAFAKGIPLGNDLTTFRELKEGNSYFPTFYKRTINPLLNHFSQEPHLLVAAAEKLGGRRADYGDVAVTINAFSRVPITIVLWQGDDEFAPEGNILFDTTIADYLSTEDVTVLCEIITWRLIAETTAAAKKTKA